MADANKDEVDKCKQVAENALAAGDADKAIRFLTKAKRMSFSGDGSVDALLERAQAVAASGGGARGDTDGGGGGDPPPRQEAPRYRTSTTSSATPTSASSAGKRTNKDGSTYTSEQVQLVQKILRAKDYYVILDLARECREEDVKKAYKKIALKLHPDKNKAPGAEEAFKKVSRAVQCLTDQEKRQMYDRYGDEDQIPQQHRGHHQQDFMTPEDLFAAFFGGGGSVFQTNHHQQQRQQPHDDDGNPQVQRAQLFQMLPVLLLVLLTLASNFGSRDSGSRFSFTANGQYRNERSSAALNVDYFVADDFDEHYSEGTRALAEFEKQVEIYYVRNLHSECDYQEKVMHKKVMIAKRRGSQDELKQARNHPRPACKQIEKIKKKNSNIYRSAMYMGGY